MTRVTADTRAEIVDFIWDKTLEDTPTNRKVVSWFHKLLADLDDADKRVARLNQSVWIMGKRAAELRQRLSELEAENTRLKDENEAHTETKEYGRVISQYFSLAEEFNVEPGTSIFEALIKYQRDGNARIATLEAQLADARAVALEEAGDVVIDKLGPTFMDVVAAIRALKPKGPQDV